jgi:hypothetical protein
MSIRKKTTNYYDEGQLQRVKTSKTKDGAIYYNVTIQSGDSSQAGVQAYYRESKLSAILDRCNDYYLAIARFSVSTVDIPILIPKVVTGQGNINKLIYTFQIGYNGVKTPVFNVTYVPQNTIAKIPQAPTTQQDVSGNYYFVYSVVSFLEMCNTAINLAFTTGGLTLPVGSLPPYFQYDPVTELISLVAQQQFYDLNPATGPAIPIYLYSNTDAANLLGQGMSNIYNGYYNSYAYTYNIYNNYNNWYNPSNLASSSPPKYLILTNEYPLNDLWTPLQAVVLTSGTIPSRDENIQPPENFGGPAINVGTGTLTSQKIITDFEPDFFQIMQARSTLQYSVTGNGNMRWIKLESSNPLNTIDITFNWLDQYGNLRPLYLYAGNCTVKFVFCPINQVDNFELNENEFN